MKLSNIALCLLVLILPGLSLASWQGYINSETFANQKYGYLSVGDTETSSAIRLVCFPPVGYRIYLDARVFGGLQGERVELAIDSLPSHSVKAQQSELEYIVTEQYGEFWDLVAQMIAGSKIRLRASNGSGGEFTLGGFTGAYTQACSWMDGASQYRKFLSDYQ